MQTVLIYNVYEIDLAIIYRVWRRRIELGFWISDLAFLIDATPLHVKEIENPTLRISSKSVFHDPETNVYTLPRKSIAVYTADQVNIIRNIFDDQDQLPRWPVHVLEEDEITVQLTYTYLEGKQRLLIEQIGYYGELKPIYIFDEDLITKAPIKFNTNQENLKAVLLQMIHSPYFNQPRPAIEIYKDIISLYKTNPKPVILEACLNYYTSRNTAPGLKCYKSSSAHTTFGKL